MELQVVNNQPLSEFLVFSVKESKKGYAIVFDNKGHVFGFPKQFGRKGRYLAEYWACNLNIAFILGRLIVDGKTLSDNDPIMKKRDRLFKKAHS